MTKIEAHFPFDYEGKTYNAIVIGMGEPQEQLDACDVIVEPDEPLAKIWLESKIEYGLDGHMEHPTVPITFPKGTIGQLWATLENFDTEYKVFEGEIFTEEEIAEVEEMEKEGVVF